jgi:CRISPR system Cascade subunit CasB
MTEKTLFRKPDAPEAEKLRAWHGRLLKQPRRGDRARLRRAGTIAEAAMQPAFHELLRDLGVAPGDGGADPRQLEQLAAAAALAAAVEPDDPGTRLGKTLGRPREGGTAPRVSAVRFRRLLESDGLAERFADLRRTLALVGGTADLAEIAGAACDWTAARRRRLAYDYYATAPSQEKETE